jgi:hypothetical protein
VNLKVEDYYPSGKRFLLRFKEKGGKEKELPVHHKLEEMLDQYLIASLRFKYSATSNHETNSLNFSPRLRER